MNQIPFKSKIGEDYIKSRNSNKRIISKTERVIFNKKLSPERLNELLGVQLDAFFLYGYNYDTISPAVLEMINGRLRITMDHNDLTRNVTAMLIMNKNEHVMTIFEIYDGFMKMPGAVVLYIDFDIIE